MQRLLLLATTTTYKVQSFLAAAERLGVAVTVGTDRPQALAALDPAGNLTLDFAHPETATRRVAEFAIRHPIDAVLAADDDGTVLAALAARALGLRHNDVEAVRAARDKRRTRAALQAAGLPVPWFRTTTLAAVPATLASDMEYPCVLKPLALSGSRGVIRADDPAEFVIAFERLRTILRSRDVVESSAALASEVLVEGYIPGVEVALEGILEAGTLRVLALFDKPDPLEGPFFEETIYVTPSRLVPEAAAAIGRMAQQACEALGLQHGPVHAELRWDGRTAWLLEAAPRSIGGLCSRALRFGDGTVSLEEILLRHALGCGGHDLERETAASGVMMVPIPQPGRLRAVRGEAAAAAVPGIEAVHIVIPPGQEVAPPPEGSRYLGFLFARGSTPQAVEAALRASHARLEIDIESPTPSIMRGESHARVHG